MTGPLIQIETVPISFEYVESAKPVSLSKSIAKLEITRDHDNLEIKSKPVEFKMDGFDKSMGRGAVGSSLSYTATAGYDSKGNMRLNLNFQNLSGDTARMAGVGRDIARMASALGGGKQDVNVVGSDGGEDFFNYFPGGNSGISISFDFSQLRGMSANATFTPPDLELQVKEYPHVVITYVGGPIYVPKSADPSYEPPAESTFEADA